VPLEVNGNETFAFKLILVSVPESGSPVFARLYTTQSSSTSPHYRWCRWKTPHGSFVNLLDKHKFLFVSEQLLCLVVDRVLPRELLLTLHLLATSDTFSDLEGLRNVIALSIKAIAAKISRVKARCC
jgi:hypothetical protein